MIRMKQRAFTGPDAGAQYQRAGMFLRAAIFDDKDAARWCRENNIAIRKAASEGIDSAGGFLVPNELAKVILDIREKYGAFRRTALVYPMGSDSTSLPRRVGGTTASFMAEGAAAASANVQLDNVGLTAKKIGALVVTSTELEEDSLPDLVDFVANELAWAFAKLEDDCAFTGDGTAAFGRMNGLMNLVLDGTHDKAKVLAASGHNTFANIDEADLGNLVAGVQAAALPNAAWFISQVGFGAAMCRLAVAHIQGEDFNGVYTPHYLGFPVIMVPSLPQATTSLSGKGMLAFGDMYQSAVLGERRGITIRRSFDRYLDQDQLAILGTERFDAVVHDLGDNTNVGCLAVLVGN